MLRLHPAEAIDPVEVEFDEYVPVTATWTTAQRLLEKPHYKVINDGATILELKFDPETGRMIEIVLVTMPNVEVVEGSLNPVVTHEFVTATWSDSDRTLVADSVRAVAYDDFLVLRLAPEAPVRYAGTRPVLFGESASGLPVSICFQWASGERDLILA